MNAPNWQTPHQPAAPIRLAKCVAELRARSRLEAEHVITGGWGTCTGAWDASKNGAHPGEAEFSTSTY